MPRKTANLKHNFNFRKLCTPSLVYLVLSLLGLVLMGIQNFDGKDKLLCIGEHKCQVSSKTLIFVIHGVYILFWTFILDLMCKAGYSELSWIVLLLPILLFFLFVGLLIYHTA